MTVTAYHVSDLSELVDLLDVVVREQAGESVADSVDRVRRLALQCRTGLPGADARLTSVLDLLDSETLRAVIRSLSCFFDLANLTEDNTRVNTLAERAENAVAAGLPRPESIDAAVARWKQEGLSAADVQRLLDTVHVEPVFTAHPSEAKRRTTREVLRRLRHAVRDDASTEVLLATLTTLWQSDLVRPTRPRVSDEVERGLFFARVLLDVVPRIYGELRRSLRANYPEHRFEIPSFLCFGTWIGGDRDGHPYVTASVTDETLEVLRAEAIKAHRDRAEYLMGVLVSSSRQSGVEEPLASRLGEFREKHPEAEERFSDLSPHELPRHWLRMMIYRFDASLGNADPAAAYRDPANFENDLAALRDYFLSTRGERIVADAIDPWMDLAATFGLHFASLDIRQNTEVHGEALREVLVTLGLVEKGANPDESDLVKLLSQEPTAELDRSGLSDQTQEVLRVFDLLAKRVSEGGLRAFGAYVISMTHHVSDVLTVLWFWKRAWKEMGSDRPAPSLPIAPLLETIDDLARGPELLEGLLTNAAYAEHLSRSATRSQMVMVGYSDSTKDGGYFAAVWRLHRGQEQLAEVADKHGVALTIFHGRGGALGRGGGPAARAIQSLPQRAFGGRFRCTEQGEVLAERYDDRFIAHRHIEQITHATFVAARPTAAPTPAEWTTAMEKVEGISRNAYRELVDHPGFLMFFDKATPIGEIETLPIASRPSRRRARRTLSDLRAIPWTFAWTQARVILPAWYGLGVGLATWADSTDGSWETLAKLYREWPMFTALIDNAVLALAKADMSVAHQYTTLIPEGADGDDARAIWPMIESEYQRAVAAVLLTTGQQELLEGTQWLRRSIRTRNPYVDPLNIAQVLLLGRKRDLVEQEAGEAEIDVYSHLLRLTIQGIAAGLRTTG